MRVVTGLALALAFFPPPAAAAAQTLPEWHRVHTFEDSFIDMNTLWVFNDGEGVFRVTFRWSFDAPQTLGGDTRTRHRSRLEVYQFDCAGGRSRLREVMPLDALGRPTELGVKNADGELRPVPFGSVTERLFTQACGLVARRLRRESEAAPNDTPEKERAWSFAAEFARRLERTQDFAPLIKEFFAPDYLSGYLREQGADWLSPLDRATAAKAGRAELQEFHTAVLNAAHLGAVYVSRERPRASGGSAPGERVIPPDVIRLVERHPYTAAYRGAAVGYDYLAENIDSVERMRDYTDLLESIAGLLRKHAAGAVRPEERRVSWREMFRASAPRTVVCAAECLGLPAGTKLFQVEVSVFQLQMTEIDGELKVVSIGPSPR